MKHQGLYARASRLYGTNRGLIGFALATVVAVVALQVVFAGVTSFSMRPKIAAYIFLGEGALATLPVWVMRGRWRALAVAGVWMAALFLWANTLYWRYWGEMIPFSLIFSGASYNSLVFDAIGPSLGAVDLLYLLIPAALTLWYMLGGVWRLPALPVRLSVAAAVLSVVVYCLCSLRVSVSIIRYMHSIGLESSVADTLDFRFSDPERISTSYTNIGLTAYTLRSLMTLPESRVVELDASQRERVARFLTSFPDHTPDPVFDANRGKNLIFVIVESLNSPYFGRVYDGHSVTPVLDSLAALEGSIVSRDIVTQVRDGSSSDGQMMYNTGMLPLKRGAASMKFGGNRFVSLAEQIGFAEKFEYIVENPAVWNHNVTTGSWGYDRLMTCYGLEELGQFGRDAVVFERALGEISRARRPFLAEVVTLSMHFPFVDEGADVPEWVGTVEFGSELERSYVAMTTYFDACLGRFLKGLREMGLMDSSVVVIVSDHTQGFNSDFDDSDDNRCVFIAANTGRTEAIDRVAGQIDVYPTILEIMGAYGTARWRGLGRSMLDPGLDAAVDRHGTLLGTAHDGGARLREANEVGELMLRSDYFRVEDGVTADPARP